MFNRFNQRINYFKYLKRRKYQSLASPYFFAYGRTALQIGLSAYNVPQGKTVLVPSYICKAAVQPFIELGISVAYYSVRNDFSPDWDSVNETLSDKVFGIMMVHYFGIAQPVDEFIEFTAKNKLLLIEDNSHGYGGFYKKQLMGTFGHIGFASPRKSFPILNGGILFLNGLIPQLNYNFPLEPVNVKNLALRAIIGRLFDKTLSFKSILLYKKKQEEPINNNSPNWSMDLASHIRLSQYDLREICAKRTRIFNIWEKWCRTKGLTLATTLNNNSSAPLSVPLIFTDREERDKWLNDLKKNHIAVYTWPDLPNDVLNSENTANELRNKILCLPIHLAMNPEKLEGFLLKLFV